MRSNSLHNLFDFIHKKYYEKYDEAISQNQTGNFITFLLIKALIDGPNIPMVTYRANFTDSKSLRKNLTGQESMTLYLTCILAQPLCSLGYLYTGADSYSEFRSKQTWKNRWAVIQDFKGSSQHMKIYGHSEYMISLQHKGILSLNSLTHTDTLFLLLSLCFSHSITPFSRSFFLSLSLSLSHTHTLSFTHSL